MGSGGGDIGGLVDGVGDGGIESANGSGSASRSQVLATRTDASTTTTGQQQQQNQQHHRRRRSTAASTSRRPSLAHNARSLSQDSLLHTQPQSQSQSQAQPHAGTAAVWDWEAPAAPSSLNPELLSTSISNPAYFYEPQGELCQEPVVAPFSVPDPVAANPLEAVLGDSGARIASRKRKASANEASEGSKRVALGMRDVGGADGVGDGGTRDETLRGLPDDGSSTRMVLPARKVFPIQIGDKLFRLSGASISSDAPSYFSQFFEQQLQQQNGKTADSVRTLYIDRDPATFCDISLHLQGYHVEPRDGAHFVKLFADAQFFSLPRLTALLFASPIHTTIGATPFRIPRDLFANSPGNSPNYFTLGFQTFFTTPSTVFPGLDQRTLLRPPSLAPPSVPNRCPEIFKDLLRLLEGYEVEVRGEEHRRCLVRDARWFGFRGVEQRLVRCRVGVGWEGREEVEVRLEDVKPSGVEFAGEEGGGGGLGVVCYARPFLGEGKRVLVLEVGGEDGARVVFECRGGEGEGMVRFERRTLARVVSLFGLVVAKMEVAGDVEVLGVRNGEEVRCVFGDEAAVTVDGASWVPEKGGMGEAKRVVEEGWLLKKSQWRIRARSVPGRGKAEVEVFLEAVKLEAYTCQRARNEGRGFL